MVNDITKKKQYEEALRKSLEEKELLIKEVHHRAKNNLVIIQSLLQLQADRVTDHTSKSAFAESQERIASIGLIHEFLYKSDDLKHMNISDYIRSLSNQLVKKYTMDNCNIRLDMDVEELFLYIEIMIPCGLIINELITNALKYAFPSRTEGTLHVGLKRGTDNSDNIVMTVIDNGIGMPEGLNICNTRTLGMMIIVSLVKQLNGSLELEGSDGTTFKITLRAPVAITT
jgi:two-component sensor histidine kinase